MGDRISRETPYHQHEVSPSRVNAFPPKILPPYLTPLSPLVPCIAHRDTQQHREKIEHLTYEVGNLTNAVIELQKLAAEHYGVTVQHPITLGEKEEGDEGVAEGDETKQDGAGGGDEGGDSPALNLRGAGADGGEPDGGGGGDVDGGSGDAADADGGAARRSLTRKEGEQREQQMRRAAEAVGDEPAALRGASAGPRQPRESPQEEG